MNRPVGASSTTISFDFDAYLPPSTSIVQPQSVDQPLPQLPLNFPSVDSTSDASLVYVHVDPEEDLLCEPFITTPDPTLSMPVFGSEPLLPSAALPYCPISSSISFSDSFDQNPYILPSSALSLLPLLPSQQINSNIVDNDIEMLVQQHFPVDGSDFCFCLSSFESMFMSNDTHEYFMSLQQQQPQCEFIMFTELSPCDYTDNSLVYEQL